MDQYVFDLVCLLDLDTYTDAIDAWLDQNPLVLVPGDGQGIKKDFLGAGGLDLGNIVSFRCLRGKVGKGEGSGEGGADALQIRA